MLSEPPDDLADRIVWRREAEEAFADKVRRKLRSIVVGAYEDYLSTLTAAGDLSKLDAIPQRWNLYILEELAPDLEEMYQAGALTAWNTAPTTTLLPATAANSWAQVIAQSAIDYQATATNRLVGVGDDIWLKVNSQVTDALAKGAGTEVLKQQIEQLTQFSEFRADTIARTEMNAAFVNGSYQGEVALGEYGPAYKEWLPVGDNRMRAEHEAMMGQPPIPFAEDFIVGGEPMAHPLTDGASAGNVVNCLVEGSVVRPIGDLLAISRAWWDGPSVEIVTADGVSLRVTPNHPVLTSRGMLPAQAIHKGNQVVTIRQTMSDADDDNVHPTVEELYRACSEISTKFVARVSGMNFHGDMPNERVDVVWPDGSLRYRLEVLEHGDHGVLVRLRDIETGSATDSHTDRSDETSLREMIAEPTPALAIGHDPSRALPQSLVGLSGDLAPLIYRHVAKAELVRLAARSDCKSQPAQAQRDRVPVHSERRRHRQDGLASLPSGTQVGLVDDHLCCHPVAGSTNEAPSRSQPSFDRHSVGLHGPSDGGDGLASVVTTTEVIEVKVHSSGHWVYNLTSSTGLLWSPAGVHSNCRCDVLYYYPGDTLPDGTLVEMPETLSQAVEIADDVPDNVRREEERRQARLESQRQYYRDNRATLSTAQDAAAKWNTTTDDIIAYRADVQQVRQAIRNAAADKQADLYGILERVEGGTLRLPKTLNSSFDPLELLSPAEKNRYMRWFDKSATSTKTTLEDMAEAARRQGLVSRNLGDDQVLEWHRAITRDIDAAGAVKQGRLPSSRIYGGIDPNTLATLPDIDVRQILGVHVDDAAGYLATLDKARYADEAYSALGPSIASEAPPWRMGFQSWSGEVLDTDWALSNAPTNGLRDRMRELIPPQFDSPGASLEDIYAAIIQAARIADLEVADYAVIPWA